MIPSRDVIIIGAGQAGLALSHCLTARGIDHIVLDRGAVAQRWRAERWASLHLLTPNWMTRLPGFAYDGNDPDGFMHKDTLIGLLNRYARSFSAPVREYNPVRSVERDGTGFRVETETATLRARAVVIATGACDRPRLPGWAASLDPGIHQITTDSYIHPGDAGHGNVLVIGGSATGVQLAEELRLSGRQVTLAIGSHVPLPRSYRGRDIMAWMDRCGILAEPRDPTIAPERAARQPSLQLVGSRPARDTGLAHLSALGVRCVGRATGTDGVRVGLSPTLGAEIDTAWTKRRRLLARIDAHISRAGLDVPPPEVEPAPYRPGETPRELNLLRDGIGTVVWATGFWRSYGWLRIPVLDGDGELVQSGGLTPVPGLYALGLPFMRRRNSTFIDGVGADAHDLASAICRHLGHAPVVAA